MSIQPYLDFLYPQAQYELMDGSWYGEIANCPGVWANEASLEKCKSELASVLESWLRNRTEQNLPMPEID